MQRFGRGIAEESARAAVQKAERSYVELVRGQQEKLEQRAQELREWARRSTEWTRHVIAKERGRRRAELKAQPPMADAAGGAQPLPARGSLSAMIEEARARCGEEMREIARVV